MAELVEGGFVFDPSATAAGFFVMGATGESVRRVTDFGFAPSWSADGSELVVSTSNFVDPFSRNLRGKLFIVQLRPESGGSSTMATRCSRRGRRTVIV